MNLLRDLPFWGRTLFQNAIHASALVPLILITQWLFRNRLNAHWRYSLWWLLVIRLALPWSVESPFNLFNFTQFPSANRAVNNQPLPTADASETPFESPDTAPSGQSRERELETNVSEEALVASPPGDSLTLSQPFGRSGLLWSLR